MLRIIDACGRPVHHQAFDRQTASAFLGSGSDQFRVKAHDLGNGHLEVTASRLTQWVEAEWSPEYLQDTIDVWLQAKSDEDEAEKDLRNRQRAARRARTAIRRACKALGVDTLLTLTYRACEADLDRAKADLKEFKRRMVRHLPNFRFVACFERQQRGAWHMHLATVGLPSSFTVTNAGQSYRVKSFNLFRDVWRSVTGERGGNVDLQKRKAWSRKSGAQIAGYISKYISKAFLDEGVGTGTNRYTTMGKVVVPDAVDLGTYGDLCDCIRDAFALLSQGQQVVTASLDRFKDWFFFAAESPPS